MGRFIDSVIALRILRLLTQPFDQTDAFQMGIIDAKGKELKKMSQLNSVNERDAYTILHRMVFRLKKIIEKVPIENKKLASYAAALALVKEQVQLNKEPIDLESLYLQKLNTDLSEEKLVVEEYLNEKYTLTFMQFLDEEVPAGIPANNAGTPGIAGLPPDQPPVSVKAQRRYTRKKNIFRRQ
jgi:hypothetical protein